MKGIAASLAKPHTKDVTYAQTQIEPVFTCEELKGAASAIARQTTRIREMMMKRRKNP